jgi:Domain of unknown function (DUF5664)
VKPGLKLDQGKPDLTLLPYKALVRVTRVMEFGCKKYARDNWRLVEDARRRYIGAGMRHLFDAKDGEMYDEESGLYLLAHAACDALFALDLEP